MVAPSWQFPDAPLRTSFVATNTVALVALILTASAARAGLTLSAAYPWKASAVFAAMLLPALGLVGTHHPFTRYGPANQTTTLRALLVALVASFVGERGDPSVAASAAALTLTVGLLDGVDGWLARRSRMASDFGARFDMEVDALLVMILSILAWQYGKAGAWVLASGFLRYGFLVAGWLRPWLARPLMPSRRRQAICVVQIAGLNVAIVPAIPSPASALLAAVALTALIYSFTIDVAWLWRQRSFEAAQPVAGT
jgi:phosphatidylglycerophosphate synthase